MNWKRTLMWLANILLHPFGREIVVTAYPKVQLWMAYPDRETKWESGTFIDARGRPFRVEPPKRPRKLWGPLWTL